MGELRFENKVENEWLCELFFNIYDDTGLLIGSSDSMTRISPKEKEGETFTISAGWGGENPESWVEDHYTMEVVFMDTVVGIIPFSIGQEFVERINDYEALLNADVLSQFQPGLQGARVEKQEESAETESAKSDAKEKPNEESNVEETADIVIDDRPLEEILSELDKLIGLENIKTKIREYVDYLSFLQIREERGD